MFTWLNKQGVQHESGFIVQITGRFTIEYIENEKTIPINMEIGFNGGMPCICVEPSIFDVWGDGATIESTERERMFKNLREALEFQDLKLVVKKGESPYN